MVCGSVRPRSLHLSRRTPLVSVWSPLARFRPARGTCVTPLLGTTRHGPRGQPATVCRSGVTSVSFPTRALRYWLGWHAPSPCALAESGLALPRIAARPPRRTKTALSPLAPASCALLSSGRGGRSHGLPQLPLCSPASPRVTEGSRSMTLSPERAAGRAGDLDQTHRSGSSTRIVLSRGNCREANFADERLCGKPRLPGLSRHLKMYACLASSALAWIGGTDLLKTRLSIARKHMLGGRLAVRRTSDDPSVPSRASQKNRWAPQRRNIHGTEGVCLGKTLIYEKKRNE